MIAPMLAASGKKKKKSTTEELIILDLRQTQSFYFMISINIHRFPGYVYAGYPVFRTGRIHPKEKYSGTGIGLAICKKVVENHYGELTVESEINRGSRFKILLPIKGNET